MSAPQTVHIIDDEPMVCHSIRLLLTDQGFETRIYASALDFLRAIAPNATGCVITDVSMPGMTGVDLLTYIKERGLDLPVIVLTGQADVPLAVHAMKQGAVDFMEKPFTGDVLVASVRKALTRCNTRPEKDANLLDVQSRLATLSAREKEVLDYLVVGRPNKIIAQELGISIRTVEVHRANLMRKSRANSLSELVRMSLVSSGRR